MREYLICSASKMPFVHRVLQDEWNWDRIGEGLYLSDKGKEVKIIGGGTPALYGMNSGTILHLGPYWSESFDYDRVRQFFASKQFIEGRNYHS